MANLHLWTRYLEDKQRFQELNLDTNDERISAERELKPTSDGYWCVVNRHTLSLWIQDHRAKIETDSGATVVIGHTDATASFYMAPIGTDRMMILLR